MSNLSYTQRTQPQRTQTNPNSTATQLSDNTTTQSSTNTHPRAKTTAPHSSSNPTPSPKKHIVKWAPKNPSSKSTNAPSPKKNTFPTPQKIGASEIKEVSKDTFKVKGSGPLDIELTYWKHALEQMKKRGFTHQDVCQAFSGVCFLSYKGRLVYTGINGVRVVIDAKSSEVITVIPNNNGFFAAYPYAPELERIDGDQSCKSEKELIEFYKKIVDDTKEGPYRRANAAHNLGFMLQVDENINTSDHEAIKYLEIAFKLKHPNAAFHLAKLFGLIIKRSKNFQDATKLATYVTATQESKHPHQDTIRLVANGTILDELAIEAQTAQRSSTYPLDAALLLIKVSSALLNPSTDLKSPEFINDVKRLVALGHPMGMLLLKALIELKYTPTDLYKIQNVLNNKIATTFKMPNFSDHKVVKTIDNFLKFFNFIESNNPSHITNHKNYDSFRKTRLALLQHMMHIWGLYPSINMSTLQMSYANLNNNVSGSFYWAKRALSLTNDSDLQESLHEKLCAMYLENERHLLAFYHAAEAYKLNNKNAKSQKIFLSIYNSLFESVFPTALLFPGNNDKVASMKQTAIKNLKTIAQENSEDKPFALLELGFLSLIGLIPSESKETNVDQAIKYFQQAQKAAHNNFLKAQISYDLGSIHLNLLGSEYQSIGKSLLEQTIKLGRSIKIMSVNGRPKKRIAFSPYHQRATQDLKHLPEVQKLVKQYGNFN